VADSRAVRIPRSRSASQEPERSDEPPEPVAPGVPGGTSPRELRQNAGGSTRATRLATFYVVVLTVFYVGFVLYDRTAPGGTSSVVENGILLFTGLFILLAAAGALYALNPAPRSVEVTDKHVTVVGRWGRRRELPPLSMLSFSVVQRYPAGWLAPTPVELIELWGENVPNRSYVVDPELFQGANRAARSR